MTQTIAADWTETEDPHALFEAWFAEARAKEPNDPEAMALATVDADGLPDVRMLLCKRADADGLVFYTNAESAKGRELAAAPRAAALFHWKSLRRQVRFRGQVETTGAADADAYFRSRPRGSRLGAWASAQSRELSSRADLKAAVAKADRTYPGEDVPRPPHWLGYRLRPREIEFWQNGEFRLHDRVLFTLNAADGSFQRRRLYP